MPPQWRSIGEGGTFPYTVGVFSTSTCHWLSRITKNLAHFGRIPHLRHPARVHALVSYSNHGTFCSRWVSGPTTLHEDVGVREEPVREQSGEPVGMVFLSIWEHRWSVGVLQGGATLLMMTSSDLQID